MSGTGELVRPDEDTFVLPEAWRRKLHPRRGGSPVPAPTKVVDKAVGTDLGGPDLTTAVARANGSRLRREVVADAWVARHGLVFAVRAAVELFSLDEQSYPALDRLRALLVAADDEIYASVVEALAPMREGERRRTAVSYLVPTETAWVNECVDEARQTSFMDDTLRSMLLCSLDRASQVEPLRGKSILYGGWPLELVMTLCESLGDAWLPLMQEQVDYTPYNTGQTWRNWMTGLPEVPTDAAFLMLLTHIERAEAQPALVAAARNFPRRALRLLGAASLGTGKPASLARTLLQAHVAAHRDVAEAALPELPSGVAALVAPVLDTGRRGPEASVAALPEALVSPPWARPGAGKPAYTPLSLTPPALAYLAWQPGEREEWAAMRRPYSIGYRSEPRWDDVDSLDDDQKYDLFVREPVEKVAYHVAAWRPGDDYHPAEMFQCMVGRFGDTAIPMALHLIRRSARYEPVLAPLVTLDVARRMAQRLSAKTADVRASGKAWLDRHAHDAVALLIPDAVGKPNADAHAAGNALRYLAESQGPDLVKAAAAEYGPEAVDAIAAVLAADPLVIALPARMPKLPSWAAPHSLAQVQLRDGAGGLPEEAVRHLLTTLAVSEPGNPYPTLAEIQEACTPDSLAAFAWSLFEAWRLSGMPAKESWALTALGTLGDDEVVRRLDPIIRAWPGEGAHKRAVDGLSVLAAIGTDIALMHLHGISQRVKFTALKARAKELIAEVADGLGLTADQLADRLVPDFGLDASGSTTVDYGTRRFTVGFDEQLKPYVLDQDGKRRKDLPAPGARDDAELAPAERKRYATLKKDVRTAASDTIRRLEAAMVTGRTWTAAEFRDLLVGHPLVGHLTRRLVWLAETDGGPVTFRVAEDRTYADGADDALTVPDTAAVRIPHPLELGDGLAVWSEVFADYEILQPFAQLGRQVFRLTDEEAAAERLTRFEGVAVPTRAVLGLVHRGWERGPALDNGVEQWIARRLTDDLYVVGTYEQGISTGFVEEFDGDQTFEGVWVATQPAEYFRAWEKRRPSDLPPVAASEIIADLTWLTSQAGR
ncbi:DUF4132 domain-containing protein [Yinghuangia seranimata]|uniref:DUF4132 domain-containing protein n=1 Tax=Yinghuangia seranimata TaxID=408067 RepID=UPI00248ADB4E|nr:DUF4132 domain-containing protein [Yinghuangia seranimata]MDI2129629.1 DUF4132 domain-containing protein [Yinghuangia seranimata]